MRSIILRKGLNIVYEKLEEKGYYFVESDIPVRLLKEAGLPVIVNCNCCNMLLTIAEAYLDETNTCYCSKCAEYVADLIEEF